MALSSETTGGPGQVTGTHEHAVVLGMVGYE